MTREELVAWLRDERHGLWPLIDYQSCALCARPRKPEYAKDYRVCFSCKQHRDHYGPALDDLVPITYSTKDWRMGRAIRRFKDERGASPSDPLAACFGAIFSSYLQANLGRICVPNPASWLVVPVPSSKPTVVAALDRAGREGWWVPALATDLVSAREGSQRQRERAGKERMVVEDKWEVNPEPLEISGPPVLLLDDIYTTGGSLHSLAQALKVAGARSVTAVVLERNLGDDGGWVLPLLEQEVERGNIWRAEITKKDVIRR